MSHGGLSFTVQEKQSFHTHRGEQKDGMARPYSAGVLQEFMHSFFGCIMQNVIGGFRAHKC